MVTWIVVARGYRHVARRASVGMEIILCITSNEFNIFLRAFEITFRPAAEYDESYTILNIYTL